MSLAATSDIDSNGYKTYSITGSVNCYSKEETDDLLDNLKDEIGEEIPSEVVSSVKVSSETLTVSPGSATSGAVEINVEADNYYTKSEVDNKINGTTATIGTATATELGAVMVGSVLSSTINVQEETTRSDRYYYVDICNSGSDSGKLVVNIPWEAGEAGGGITDLSVSGTSPLNLIGTVNGSVGTITGNIDMVTSSSDGLMDSVYYDHLIDLWNAYEAGLLGGGGDVDLSNYATKDYVTSELSNYQKKLEIANNISVTFPEGDVEDSIALGLELNDNILSLNGVFNLGSLATQNYVDEAVRNGGTTLNYYSENTSSKTAYLGSNKASSIVINPTDQIEFVVENANWGSIYENGGEPQANLGTTIFNIRPEVTIIDDSNRKGDNNIVVFNDLNDYQEKLTAGSGITIFGNTISATGSTIGTATDEQLGLVKVGTTIISNVSVNPETYENGKYYYVDMLGEGSDAGKLVVNVPWYASEGGGGGGTSLEKVVCTATSPLNLSGSVTDSGATLNLSGNIGTAGEDNYGVVRIGSVIAAGVEINNTTTTAGRYYHVDIMHPADSNDAGRLVVNVPWEAGSGGGSGITSIIGSALAPLTLGGKISGEQLTIEGSIATASEGNLGVVMPYYDSNGSVLANSQTTTSGRTYGIAGQSDGKLTVNVPWTDTTYTAGSGISISSSNVISSTSSYHHYEEVYSGNNDSTDYARMYTHYNSVYGVFESVASSNLASGSNIYFTTDYIGVAGSLPEIYSRDDSATTRPRAVLAVHPDFIKFTIDQLSDSEYSNELVFDRNALYVGGTQVPVPQISANQTNPSADIYFYNSQLITGTIDSDTTYNFHQTNGKKGAQVQIILQATKDVTVTLTGTYAKVTDGYTNFTVSSNKYVEINAVYDGNYIYVRSGYMES